jgi:hypothetical protein
MGDPLSSLRAQLYAPHLSNYAGGGGSAHLSEGEEKAPEARI